MKQLGHGTLLARMGVAFPRHPHVGKRSNPSQVLFKLGRTETPSGEAVTLSRSIGLVVIASGLFSEVTRVLTP